MDDVIIKAARKGRSRRMKPDVPLFTCKCIGQNLGYMTKII
jgi:hypothetical protein